MYIYNIHVFVPATSRATRQTTHRKICGIAARSGQIWSFLIGSTLGA